jgi:ATP-dependent DNA ligase
MRPEARGLLCQCKRSKRVALSPATTDLKQARRWLREGSSRGLDGVVAKRLDCEYTSGERTGMVKVKRIRTADCVVGEVLRGKRQAAPAAGPEKIAIRMVSAGAQTRLRSAA